MCCALKIKKNNNSWHDICTLVSALGHMTINNYLKLSISNA